MKYKAMYHINARVNITDGIYKGKPGIVISYDETTNRYCVRVQLGLFFFNYTHTWLSTEQMEISQPGGVNHFAGRLL